MPSSLPAADANGDRVAHQDHFDVVLRRDGIVWLRRTDIVYPTVAAVRHAYDEFLATVDEWLLDRRIKSGELGTRLKTPMAWLYDVRGAPARRNDPEFEAVVQERRADLLQRSPLLAVLVETASGRMQVTRLARTSSANLTVFDNPDEAVASLLARMRTEF